MASNLKNPYPDYNLPYVGLYAPTAMQNTYNILPEEYRAGVLNRCTNNLCIDSYLVDSSYGNGLPAGIFVKLKSNNCVDYLTENDTVADIFGMTVLIDNYITSAEGIPGVRNNDFISIVRPLAYFSGSFFTNEFMDINEDFGVVVKSNDPAYLLGSVANSGSSKSDDVYVLPITNNQVRLIDIEDYDNNIPLVFLEYKHFSGFKKSAPPSEDYPALVGTPTFENRVHLLGGLYNSGSSRLYKNTVLTIDRETGFVNPNLIGQYAELTMPGEMLRPSCAYMLDYVKVIFGGALGYLSSNSIIDVDGNSVYWQTTSLQIPDAESRYGISGEHFVTDGAVLLSQFDPNEQNPELMSLGIYHIGGRILSYDGQIIKKINNCHKASQQSGLTWEESTDLKIGNYWIDASKICSIQSEKYILNSYAVGCGKYTEEDPDTVIYDSIFKFSASEINEDLTIEEFIIDDLETLNVLQHLKNACGEVVEIDERKYIYYMTSGLFVDTQGISRNFAILKLTPGNMEIEIILGNPLTELIPTKEFFMTGSACIRGIGENSNYLFFYGATNILNTLNMNIVVKFNFTTDSWTIHLSNFNINLPIYSVCSNYPLNYIGDDIFELIATPTYQNTNLIVGGIID